MRQPCWDSRAAQWTVRLKDGKGSATTLTTRFLFVGSGYYDYDVPYDAQIPGIETFGGRTIRACSGPRPTH